MGLIRNAAIVAVAITLIPADPQDRAQLYTKAHNGMTWAMTFCDRNETTCEKGRAAKEVFVEKAIFAASAAYDIALVQLTSSSDQPQLGEPRQYTSPHQPRQYTRSYQPRTGTLTPYDREIGWRGPQR